ncbi:hypothetical protein [Pseudomonas synxantha]|uniref:hypothetical protein n=1 Tax=Pseudomonas synxantha TaxID=47883 RepID=UPI000F574F59|nr:hypothetical protein [Pseudomonas synxantha]
MYGAQFSKLRTTACLNDGVKLLLERIPGQIALKKGQAANERLLRFKRSRNARMPIGAWFTG